MWLLAKDRAELLVASHPEFIFETYTKDSQFSTVNAMKKLLVFLGLGLAAFPIVTLTRVGNVNAGTLVVCGPNGAARIVEEVPVGCHVLNANRPPGQK